MPKARTHRRGAGRSRTESQKQGRETQGVGKVAPGQDREGRANGKSRAGEAGQTLGSAARSGSLARSKGASRARSGTQGVMMPILVACVCFGTAVALAFFSADPNRYLFSALATLMGCMWSYMFWVRLRRLQRR